jgi:beta-galactosidase
LSTEHLPKGIRVRERGNVIFVFNYGTNPVFYAPEKAHLLIGQQMIEAAGVAIWQKK